MRLLALCAVAAAAAMLLFGCSTSSVFPAVLAGPAPRPDVTLSPAQVREATENLMSERRHLCLEAVATGSADHSGSSAAHCSGGDVAATASIRGAGVNIRP